MKILNVCIVFKFLVLYRALLCTVHVRALCRQCIFKKLKIISQNSSVVRSDYSKQRECSQLLF